MENLDFIIATIIVTAAFLTLIIGTYQEFSNSSKADKVK